MAGTKKGKGIGKGKGGGKKETKKELKRTQEELPREAQSQLTPQERVAAVKPFWQTISSKDREALLTISLDDLQRQAETLATKNKKSSKDGQGDADVVVVNLEPTLEDVLDQGVSRLKGKGTWKVWRWSAEGDGKQFYDAESFRQYVEENHISEDFRKLLPKDEGKPVEKPAEAALRQRMTDLLQRIQQNTRQLQEEMNYTRRLSRGQRATSDQLHTAVRDTNVDLITHMLEALEREHEFLYHAVLFPLTGYVCEALPENMRESSRTELFFEDLEKLPPEEVARICEWLTEKVDSFSAKLKPEAKEVEEEDEEEGIGDVDLFTLTEDSALTVNKKWLQHLEERLLGDDGHPRKVQEGEDPHKMGLVLEWVYGTIVSTAEKARDAAKRSLGARPPTALQAHEQLMTALADQQNWELRAKQAKELLKDMLASRRQAAELLETYDIRPVPSRGSDAGLYSQSMTTGDDLPDQVIVSMLQREALLTKAKLHALCYEHIMGERRLRSLKAQLRQGEPEFDRLKRELEEVKNQPRGLEGTFRTAAEMERHRAQLADAAIEEQLEVQTAFREHGARLQGIYDRRQRTEIEMAKREQEMKQLQGWKTTVQTLVDRFEELIQASEMFGDIEEGGKPTTTEGQEGEAASATNTTNRNLMLSAQALTQQNAALQKLRVHFSKDVRRQLYTDDDDKQFFDWIQRELRSVEKRLDDGRAALQHLEMHLINVACDDPGAAIGSQLALPMLQERLDAKALEYAALKAKEAEQDIIKMEEEMAARERMERERKAKLKQKHKDKLRTEKERLQAEKEAREREELEKQKEEEKERKDREEADRKRRQEELELARKQEEAIMEARRKELLSEENGYWKHRMQQEQDAEAHARLEEELIFKDDNVPNGVAESQDGFTEELHAAKRAKPRRKKLGDGSTEDSAVSTTSSANGYLHRDRGAGKMRWELARPAARDTSDPVENRSSSAATDRSTDSRPRSQTGQVMLFPAERTTSSDSTKLPNSENVAPNVRVDKQIPQLQLAKAAAKEALTVPIASPAIQTQPVAKVEPLAQQQAATPPSPLAAAAAPPAALTTVRLQQRVKPAVSEPVTRDPSDPSPAAEMQQEPQSVPPAASIPTPVTRAPGATAVAMNLEVAAARGVPPQPLEDGPRALSLPQEPAQPHPAVAVLMPTEVVAPAAMPPMPATPTPAPPPTNVNSIVNKQSQPKTLPPQLGAPPPPKTQVLIVPRHHPLVPQQSVQVSGPGPRPPVPGPPHVPPAHMTMRPMIVQQQIVGKPVASTSRPHPLPSAVHGVKPPGPKVVGMQPTAGPVPPPAHVVPAGHIDRNRPGEGRPLGVSPVPHAAHPPMLPQAQQPMEAVMSRGSDGAPAAQSTPLPPPGPMPGPSSHPSGPMHIMHPQQASMQPVMMPGGPPYPHYPSMNMPGPQGVPQLPANGHAGPGGMPLMMYPGPAPMLGQHMQPGANFMYNPYMMGPMMPMMVQPGANVNQHGHAGPTSRPDVGPSKQSTSVGTGPRSTGSQLRAAAQPFVPSGMRGYNYLGMKQAQNQRGPPLRNQPAAAVNSSTSSSTANPPAPADAHAAAQQAQRPSSPPANNEGQHRQQQPHLPMSRPACQPPQPPKDVKAHASDAESPKGVLDRTDTIENSTDSNATSTSSSTTAVRDAPCHDSKLAEETAVPQPAAKQPSPPIGQKPNDGLPAPASTKVLVLPCDGAQSAPFTNSSQAAQGAPRNQLQASQLGQQQQMYQKRAQQPFQQPRWSTVAAREATTQMANQRNMQQARQGYPRDMNRARYSESASQPKQLLRPPTAVLQQQQQQQAPPAAKLTQLPTVAATTSSAAVQPVAVQPLTAQPTAAAVSTANLHSEEVSSTSRVSDASPPSEAGKSTGLQHVSSSGSMLSTTSTESKKRKIRKAGGLTVEGFEDDLKRLKLVRGLINDSGQYNCFLNVIIQSLWHLRCFREYMLHIKLSEVEARSGNQDDIRVMKALQDIFHAFANAPENIDIDEEDVSSPSEPKPSGQPKPSANAEPTAAAEPTSVGRSSGSWAVSPTQLREALSILDKGRAAASFELQEMHDASEVLGEIFSCLHRAELGKAAEGVDIQLPVKVKLPVKPTAGAAAGPGVQNPGALPDSGMANGVPSRPEGPRSGVQQMFGLEIQVPVATDEEQDEEQGFNKKQTKWQRKQAAGNKQVVNGAQRKPTKAFVEVQQFTKFFHLVPAQGLRIAAESLPNASFEDVVREAETVEKLSQRGGYGGQHNRADSSPTITLMRRFDVLTLCIVWESPQVSQEALSATMNSLRTSLDASGIFRGASLGLKCQLRCLVTYFGHHYQSYVLSEELHQWLLFDDTTIKVIGEWKDVLTSIISNRIQPSVLFYETVKA